MSKNVIYALSKKFALRIIRLYAYLRDEKREFVMSKQVYRSGTSIGANVSESLFAQSDADYINKLKIALKEASETQYWIDLLFEAEYLDEQQYNSLIKDINIIVGTLVKIINKIKEKGKSK